MEECMNREFKFGTIIYLILAVFIFALISCNIFPQTAEITIKNSSGEEAKDITVFYSHADGERTKKIGSLMNNESKTFTVELTNPSLAIGAGILSGIVEIEYYINDKKYTRDGGKGDNGISDGNELIIIINKDGWSAERKYEVTPGAPAAQ
jgi:hypothetical protein